MPRSVGYNSIAGSQILCFPANCYEQNLQNKKPKQPKKTPNKQKIY